MAQQTAVGWLIDQLRGFKTKDGDVAFIGVIPKDLIEKAEQIEKERHAETFKQSRQAKIFEDGMPPVWENFEQYYKQTYEQTTDRN